MSKKIAIVASDAFIKRCGGITREEQLKEFGEVLYNIQYVCNGCRKELASVKMGDGTHLCFNCFDNFEYLKKSELMAKFITILDDNGDMFFSCGNSNEDWKNIVQTIASQGYWAGNSLRYYFDDNFNLERTEERSFA